MTRARPRRKRRSGLAWTDLRAQNEVVFMAASVWLSSDPESPTAESGRESGMDSARGSAESPYGAHPLECWGHSGPARPDMATRALVEHFGSLSEARRVYRTLSESARDERPELARFMESGSDESD